MTAPHRSHLDDLAQKLAQQFALCGIAVACGRETGFHIGTAPGIAADPDTVFRVASVSKILTAAAFEQAAGAGGLTPPYDVDAGPVLGLDLRHPAFPQTPVTLGMLMTHTAGLTDDGGYAFVGDLRDDWSPARNFGPHQPGTYFSYCNLGYILLAAATEMLSGVRFDHFVARAVLGPNRLIGGFNWSGVTDRSNTLPTFRKGAGGFAAQIDETVPSSGVMHPQGGIVDDDTYGLGGHTAQLSPQGGWRTSLRGMLTLAQSLSGHTQPPLWHQTDGAGDYLDGVFQHYGAGVQHFDTPHFYPRPLVGHFGNAYGFNGGVWCDAAADIAFAYALNGVPEGDESDAMSDAELAIFDAVSALSRTAP